MADMEAHLSALVSRAELQLHQTPLQPPAQTPPTAPNSLSPSHPFQFTLPPVPTPPTPTPVPSPHSLLPANQAPSVCVDTPSQPGGAGPCLPPAQIQAVLAEPQRALDALQLNQMLMALHRMEDSDATVR